MQMSPNHKLGGEQPERTDHGHSGSSSKKPGTLLSDRLSQSSVKRRSPVKWGGSDAAVNFHAANNNFAKAPEGRHHQRRRHPRRLPSSPSRSRGPSSSASSASTRNPALEHDGRDLGEEAGRGQVDGVHGLSTRRPSFERPTHRWSLPVGRRVGSSFAAQGRPSSRPTARQRRTVLTCLHRASNSCSTPARSEGVPSSTSRASWRGCRTPTSLSSSRTARFPS